MLKKSLLLIFIIVLTIYSPIELTRLIWKWWDFYHGYFGTFVFETSFIWITYLGAMVLVSWLIWKKNALK